MKKALGSPDAEVTGGSECCKSHPDPQEGKPMLLSVAPFLSLSPGESPSAHKCCGTSKPSMYHSGQAPGKRNKEAQCPMPSPSPSLAPNHQSSHPRLGERPKVSTQQALSYGRAHEEWEGAFSAKTVVYEMGSH